VHQQTCDICCCACVIYVYEKAEFCAVLCCVVLCCAVLCCAVLCCAVLCCAVLWEFAFHSWRAADHSRYFYTCSSSALSVVQLQATPYLEHNCSVCWVCRLLFTSEQLARDTRNRLRCPMKHKASAWELLGRLSMPTFQFAAFERLQV
jgi:hypothetical protein